MERSVTKKKYKQCVWEFGGMRTTWVRKKRRKKLIGKERDICWTTTVSQALWHALSYQSHKTTLLGRTFLPTDKMSLRKEKWHPHGHIASKYIAGNHIHIWESYPYLVTQSQGLQRPISQTKSAFKVLFLLSFVHTLFDQVSRTRPGRGQDWVITAALSNKTRAANHPGFPRSEVFLRTQDFQCWNCDHSGKILIGELSGSATKRDPFTMRLIVPCRNGLNMAAK